MKFVYFIQYLLFMLIFAPLAAMPYGFSVRLGRLCGVALYHLAGRRREIALENIRMAMDKGEIQYPGGAEAMAKEVFRNLGQWFVEIVRVLFGFGRRLVESVDVEGLENVNQALQQGRGVILASAHLGNWELMVISATAKMGSTLHGAARKQNNPYINNFIVRAREKFGTKIIYKHGLLRKSIAILRSGGIVGAMLDQHVSANMGYLLNFLGSPAYVSRTPATLAKKTGAALIPFVMRYMDKRHIITFLPEVPVGEDLEAATAEANARIAGLIREAPAQWLWIHRRWKMDPHARSMDDDEAVGD